jgi:hypothetical protein
MTSARWGLAAAVLVALGMSSEARAGGLELKQVAADAKWVAHVDCDAMRTSTVVQKAWDKLLDLDKGAKGRIEEARNGLGMDITEDLHSITVYGSELGKEPVAVIFNAKINREKLEGLAANLPDHKVVDAGPYKVHSWTHQEKGHTRPIAGAIKGDNLVVLAENADRVKAALAVLDGKAPAMADDGPLRGRAVPGAMAVLRVTGIAGAKIPNKPALVEQTESFRFTIGENEGKVFYRARATMTNEEVVGQVKTVLEGVRALAQIHVKGDAKGKAIVDATQVTTEGKNVTVSLSVPADDMWEQIVKHGKIVIERRKAKGK